MGGLYADASGSMVVPSNHGDVAESAFDGVKSEMAACISEPIDDWYLAKVWRSDGEAALGAEAVPGLEIVACDFFITRENDEENRAVPNDGIAGQLSDIGAHGLLNLGGVSCIWSALVKLRDDLDFEPKRIGVADDFFAFKERVAGAFIAKRCAVGRKDEIAAVAVAAFGAMPV